MIQHKVDDHSNSTVLSCIQQVLEILHGSKIRINAVIIGYVISVIRMAGVDGAQPDAGNPKVGCCGRITVVEIIQFFYNAVEVANPISIAVIKRANKKLVEDSFIPPTVTFCRFCNFREWRNISQEFSGWNFHAEDIFTITCPAFRREGLICHPGIINITGYFHPGVAQSSAVNCHADHFLVIHGREIHLNIHFHGFPTLCPVGGLFQEQVVIQDFCPDCFTACGNHLLPVPCCGRVNEKFRPIGTGDHPDAQGRSCGLRWIGWNGRLGGGEWGWRGHADQQGGRGGRRWGCTA